MTPNPEMRIGDAEREAAVAALGEHYAAGRLTKEEYDERSAKAYAARTNADLRPLFYDLPGVQTRKAKTEEEARAERRELRRQKGWWATVPLVPVFLVVVGVVLLTHHPWLILVAVWLFWIGAFKRWSWRRQWARDRYRAKYGDWSAGWSPGWSGRDHWAGRRW